MIAATLASAAIAMGVPVTVHCATDPQTNAAVDQYHMPSTPQGWSFLDERVVYLRQWVCRHLMRPRLQSFVAAVGIFAHELGHVATHSYNERAAERWRSANQRLLRGFLS